MAIALQGTPTVTELATGTSIDVAYPTGIQAGELLVCSVNNSGASVPATPAGFTLAKSQTNANGTATSIMTAYKVATGSESGTIAVASNVASGRITGIMMRLSGVDTTTPIDVAASSANGATGASWSVPSITTVTNGALLYAHTALNASSSADITHTAAQMTSVANSTGTGRRARIWHETFATAGATGTRTFQSNPTTTLQWTVALIAFRPAAGGTAGNVSAVTATATTAAPVPGVTGGDSNTYVAPPRAQVTAAAPVPVVGAGPQPVLVRSVNDVPGTTTMAVKTNTTNAASVRIKAGTNSAITTGVVFGGAATPDGNGNAEPTITGLTANTPYFYRIAMTDAGGQEHLDTWSVGEFKTDIDGQQNFSIGFGSCTNNTDSTALGAVATKKPDLFLHLGDEYYADASGTSVANFRTKMGDKKVATNHKAVLRTSGSSYCPSDHDGMNNGTNAGTDSTAWTNWNQVYREMNPTTGLPGGTGIYRSFKRGRVRIIRIDRRSFASNPANTDNSSKTSLGTTQKQWLKDEITNAVEPVIIIQNPDPWVGAAEAGDDGWFGYTTERTELANHISSSGKNVVILSGDMHAVAYEDGSGAPGGVTTFNGGPFHQNASQKGGPWDAIYPSSGTTVVQQYGWIDVTDTGSTIALAFKGFSADNTQRVSYTKTFQLAVEAVAAVATTQARNPVVGVAPTVAAVAAVTTVAAPAPGVAAVPAAVVATAASTAPAPAVSVGAPNLALHASAPAAVLNNATSATTASFTPPLGALVVVVTAGSALTQQNPAVGLTDTGSGLSSWTLVDRANPNTTGSGGGGGVVTVHWATVTASVAMTITATITSGSAPTWIKTYVITGAQNAGPIGVSAKGFATTNQLNTTAVTTTTADAWFLLASVDWTASSDGTYVSTTQDIGVDQFNQRAPADVLGGLAGFKAVATPASTSAHADSPGTGSREWHYIVAEVERATPLGNVAAVVATGSTAAIAPVVGGGLTVAAVPAAASAAAPVPTVGGGVTVTAVTGTASAAAPIPTVAGFSGTVVLAVPATATTTAPAPAISGAADTVAVRAQASADAVAPVVQGAQQATVVAITATAAAAAPVPGVVGGNTSTVAAPAAIASAAAPAPTIGYGTTTAVPNAHATAAAPEPDEIAYGYTVVATTGLLTAQGVPPGVIGWAQTDAVRAIATAAAGVPFVQGSGATFVNAITATATAAAAVPGLAYGWTVSAVRGQATAAAGVPTVTGGSEVFVAVVRAQATADAVPPVPFGYKAVFADPPTALVTCVPKTPTVTGAALVTAVKPGPVMVRGKSVILMGVIRDLELSGSPVTVLEQPYRLASAPTGLESPISVQPLTNRFVAEE